MVRCGNLLDGRRELPQPALMRIRQSILFPLLLLAAALPQAPAFAQAASGPAPQTLRMGVSAEFLIDPHFLFFGPNMAASREIYDSFVGRDADSRWVPGLATSWRPIDDLHWEFKLRQGVTFQDGSPFTAKDVLFNFQRIPNIPNNPGPFTPDLHTITNAEAIDDYTVRITTAVPNPGLPGQLTDIFIVSSHAAAGAGTQDFVPGKAAVGTGPFRVVSYTRGQNMILERNETYWGKKPDWARVDERVVPNDGARLAALLAGDLDVIGDVPTTDAARLKTEPGVQVFSRSSDRVMFLLPNVGADTLDLLVDAHGQKLAANPLREMKVRQAISLAIDRRALAARAIDGMAIPTGQLVPEGFGGFDPALPVPKADPAGARKLLAEAGFPDGFGLTVGCTNGRYVADVRVCQTLAQMLTRAGFQAKVDAMLGSVFMARTRAGKNDLPLMLYGLSLSTSRNPEHMVSLVEHSLDQKRGLGDGNRGGFKDAGLDSEIDAAVRIMDDDTREAALHAAMMHGVALGGTIPLYAEMTIAATRKGFAYAPRMDEQMTAQQATLQGTAP